MLVRCSRILWKGLLSAIAAACVIGARPATATPVPCAMASAIALGFNRTSIPGDGRYIGFNSHLTSVGGLRGGER